MRGKLDAATTDAGQTHPTNHNERGTRLRELPEETSRNSCGTNEGVEGRAREP